MKRILFLLLLLPFYCTSQTISCVAGINLRTYSGNGGPATAAGIELPIGIAIDTAGNIYFTADEIDVIRKIDRSGIISLYAGTTGGYSGDGGPASAAKFSGPQGLTFDKYGNMYIADGDSPVVRMINTAGIITTVAGSGTPGYSGDNGPATKAQFTSLADVKVDTAGNIYISDYGVNVIRKVNKSGIITTIAGTGASGHSGDGGPATAATLSWPAGLAFDRSGNLCFSDYSNNLVRMIDSHDTIHTIVGTYPGGFAGDGKPATAASIWGPWGIAFDSAWNLLIVETYNNRIRKVDTAGIISTVVGNGFGSSSWTGAYAGDNGPATAAELYWPAFVAIGPAGSYFITDESNKVIRRVDTTPPRNPLVVQQLPQKENNFQVIPDPNNGTFSIRGSLNTPGNDNVCIEARNMIGQVVYQNNVLALKGMVNGTVILPEDLPNGMYVLHIRAGTEVHTIPFVTGK